MCTPPVPILSQLDLVNTLTSYFLKIYLNFIFPSTPGSPKWALSLRFVRQNPLLSPIRATFPAHLILLHFGSQTILVEQYRSLSSSLCNFFSLLSTLFSNYLSLLSSLDVSDQVSHPCKTTGLIIILYISIFKFLDCKLQDKAFFRIVRRT